MSLHNNIAPQDALAACAAITGYPESSFGWDGRTLDLHGTAYAVSTGELPDNNPTWLLMGYNGPVAVWQYVPYC